MRIIRTIYELEYHVARHRRQFTDCGPYKLTWYVSPEQWAYIHTAGGTIVYKSIEAAMKRLDISIVKTLEFDSYFIATPLSEVATSISTCDLESGHNSAKCGQDESKKETLGFYSYMTEGAMLPPTEEQVANLQMTLAEEAEWEGRR